MANITITEVDAAVPEFWGNIALGALKANTVMTQLVNRDYESIVATRGETINVVQRGALSVNDKTANNPVTLQNPTNTKISIVLNNHKEISWLIEDIASAKAIASAIDYVQDAAKKLGETLDSDLLGLYTACPSNVGSAGVDLAPDVIVDARKTLNDQFCPLSDRYLVISSKDDANLLKQEKFTSAGWITDNQRALRDGFIDRKYGFWIFMDQQVKTSGASPTTTHNLAFTRDAFTLATRPLPAPPSNSGASSVVVEMDSIALRVTRSYDHRYLGTLFSVDVLYGYKELRPEFCTDVYA